MYSRPARALARPDHERPDAVRIAEPDDAMTEHHGDRRIAAPHATVHRAQGREDVRGRRAQRSDALQLAREHVQQHFRV
jgi:hypothetical protein